VPLPVWNRNQGGIRQAEAQVTAAQHAISRVEQSLRQRLAAIYERYASARYASETYRGSILDNARENLELADELYRAGDVNYLTLLTAQRTYFEKNLAYLESLRDAWLALVEIEGFVLTGARAGTTESRPRPAY
jgi:cobalt-zinc-cadmium efflux system outer membrane protein